MYILAAGGAQIVNTEFVERFCIAKKEDAALIVASYGQERTPVTMARYRDTAEASEALCELLAALSGGQLSFQMPDSTLYYGEYAKKDARVKRRGGS